MCDKCNLMGKEGHCGNRKATMYQKYCPATHGMDVNDCPYAVIDCRACAEECKKPED
jgi:hypothetical protein